MNEQITKSEARPPQTAENRRLRVPHYEVASDKHAYDVRVYMPGVPKGESDITIDGDVLTIEGRKNKAGSHDWKTLHREISNDDFKLRLQLNVDIDAEKVSATTEAGVLTVHLPVAEEAKPRRIAVD